MILQMMAGDSVAPESDTPRQPASPKDTLTFIATPPRIATAGVTPDFGSGQADLVSQEVCDLELTFADDLALLDDAVGTYLADFYRQNGYAKHLSDFTSACRFPESDPRHALDPGIRERDEVEAGPTLRCCSLSGSQDDSSECGAGSMEASVAAQLAVDLTSGILEFGDTLHADQGFREVTAETCLSSAQSGSGPPGALLEEEADSFSSEREPTEWEDGSVFGEQALDPFIEEELVEQALLSDDDLPAVFNEHAMSGVLRGSGSGGEPAPLRQATSSLSLVSGAGAGPPPRSTVSKQVARGAEVRWHSRMLSADDCPDQVISFEPVYDELELDFLKSTGQDTVYRKTKPMPCRQPPRKTMSLSVCGGEGGHCHADSNLPTAAGAADAVGAYFNASLVCRSASRRAQSQPSW